MRLYKKAMRDFQDEYHDKVGEKCGLTRIGPSNRRLSRKEWVLEKSAAKQLSKTLAKLDKYSSILNEQKLKILNQKTQNNNHNRSIEYEFSK
ncbi:hypothetical protein DMW06_25390 [Vibrio parahaemolyticus]|nr:hypothetical protein [Vibrio parahaemolyticus]